MKKKPTLYIIIISTWICCLGLLIYSLTKIIMNLEGYSTVNYALIITLLVINTMVLGSLWFGSIKDFVFSTSYAILHRKLDRQYKMIEESEQGFHSEPRVLLLYCTCNDFNAEALTKSRKQTYSNFTTVILDDSKDPQYRKQINRYVATHTNIKVVRRSDHSGYKAGNINHYLQGLTEYDYFVILDSDEIIPPDFIVKTLKYFHYDPHCGAVQARHTATKGSNVFQRLMGLSVGSNGTTVQVIKNFYGANALIGHGMIISRECYEKTGGFPLVVAEDISFAVKIKDAGFNIIYAPNILCHEEFPVNYVSLKKRQCKWTQGNLEYMKKFGHEINQCKMSWFEKLDLKLSHYSLPIVPMMSFLLAVCTILLGLLGYPIIHYSLLIYIIMIIFLCSPMIPDLFVYQKSKNVLLLIPYFITNIITYASLEPMMLKTITLGLFGKKAVFLVTPKQSEKFSILEALKYSWDSLLFATVISLACYFSCGSILPVIFITVGCIGAPFVILLSNINLKTEKEKEEPIAEKHPIQATSFTMSYGITTMPKEKLSFYQRKEREIDFNNIQI